MPSVETLINRQFLRWERDQAKRAEEAPAKKAPPPIVTVSRQTGSRGSYFASRLAQRLDFQRIHREVIDEICKSSGYRKRIVESLDEHYRSDLELMVESVLTGQGVDHSDYVHHLCQVILAMSRLGGVVLVGRGGSFVLGPRRGLHVRFVAPRERRIRNLVTYKHISAAQAEALIEESDRARAEFVHKVYGGDIDDPRQYDLTINAACIDVEEIVDAVAVAYRGKMDKLAHLENDQP